MNVFPPNMLRRLQNLEELKIKDCDSVEEVFEVRGENVDEICDKGSTQLRRLTLSNLPKLKHVWTSDPEAILTFQNLLKVKVSRCKTLKSLFPVSVAKSLEHLESLCINDCGLLEEIVTLEEGLETMTKFVFPQITSLTLQSLPELKCFYPGKHTSEWPSLESLMISKCDKVKIVASNELSFTETDELGDHVPVQQPLFLIEKVAFFNLETIFINDINNLKMLWHNQLVSDSICKIKELHVGSCKNLMNVFPPNMLRSLQNLEELKIKDCDSVEEVFEVRGENVDEICDKGSTQLRRLTLSNLPKLKHVWTSDPNAILTFQNLLKVKVSRCKTLKSLFPVSVAKSLEHLESLCINDCGLLEEIVALEEGLETMTKFVFPQITSLTLKSLPELKCFYPGKHTLEWPSLKSLTISECEKVRIVALNELSFTETDELGDHVPVQQPLFLIEKVAFFNLETIFINGINNLKMLWHNQLVSDSICKIKELRGGSCKNLMNVFPPNMLRRLQNLEELKIKDCDSVEEVFEVRGENVDEICDKGSTQLRRLTLSNLPKLKHVWTSDPETILTFQNLLKVKVSGCKTLKSLFPVSVAKSLEHLESLCINDCGLLEEIVALEEGLETMTKFVFPQITSLTLQSLPELKCFYPGKHTSEWPSLKSLTIFECDKVTIVASNELRFKETDELGDHVPVQQPLFLIEKVAFFNLETIFIKGINNLKMLWHNQLVSDSICKIEELHVGSCKNLMNVFPPNMLRRLQNLEELKIKDCDSVEEVFEVRGENVDEICDKGSTQLRRLTLSNLPKLKHVWTSDPEAILTFQNLLKVKVSRCKTLKSLFPVSVAKSLEHLESLCINDCGLLEEIVTLEEGLETMTKFVFPQITSLTLQSLPELKCFYPGKHTSEWPSLKSLTISKCDKVKIVALNELSFSNELSFTETDELGDHVPVQQPLFLIEKVAFFNLETIFINGINNLKMLWHNQLVSASICKIKKLHVGSCKNLMNIFPPNMLRRLQNLEELKIEHCHSVEEVFEVRGENVDEICDKGSTQLRHLTLINLPKLKHVWTSDLEAILTFQNLCQVEVSRCKTLKSLFPVSVAKSLEQLESLRINDCELVEEIVTLEEGLETMTKFVFPQITSLTLQSLFELKCFYPGKHTSEWPSLKSLTISKCDKVKILASNELSFTETDELGDHVPVQQPLFLIEKVAFFNLETIFIDGINNLKMLWHNQLVSDSISKIKKLHVDSCKNLMNVFPPNMLRRLQNLEELKIEDCNSVEEVFEVRGENVDEICDKGSTQLRHLTLINLPKLKHVWTSDPEAILTFQNLHRVEVSKCKTLKSLFPVSVAKSLEHLESLHINDCGLMEEIVALEEGLETKTKFVFPRIISLTLQSLPELKCFYPGKHTSEWPSLKSLKICKCNKVKIVALNELSFSNELSFPNTNGLGDHVLVQQPLFLIEKDTFPNLKSLELDWYDTKNQTNGRLFGEFFCKLEVLRLYSKDHKVIAGPSVFVEGLRSLKVLSVSNLFFNNEGQYAGMFEHLTELNLQKMPKLMLLWKENSEQGRALQNLKKLTVSECGRLKNLVPSSMYFRNLNALSVRKCHGLISLATSSTVKSLVQLKQLCLYECKRMREIVTNEGAGEAGDEICFNQLNVLWLFDLPSLRSFHLGNRTIKFPSLKDLAVSGCPEMKIFSNGVLSMPKLKRVGLDENQWWPNKRELLPEEDVNSAIKRFWEENYDPCVQQLFIEKTDASTSEAGEEIGVDNLRMT
ncbi:uncharacterized protein LOC142642908 isoform X1 [Castanea sativa]|uniref:uncharacterized protein LOC142642908 isoform X1 n=1 Tax=Castanea sativa TaxID=21020 RepID=UPI003F64C1BA